MSSLRPHPQPTPFLRPRCRPEFATQFLRSDLSFGGSILCRQPRGAVLSFPIAPSGVAAARPTNINHQIVSVHAAGHRSKSCVIPESRDSQRVAVPVFRPTLRVSVGEKRGLAPAKFTRRRRASGTSEDVPVTAFRLHHTMPGTVTATVCAGLTFRFLLR